jgi:hypothetical protein
LPGLFFLPDLRLIVLQSMICDWFSGVFSKGQATMTNWWQEWKEMIARQLARRWRTRQEPADITGESPTETGPPATGASNSEPEVLTEPFEQKET